MRRERENNHLIESLAALLLFGVFAACVLSVLLTGAGAYRHLTERDRTAFDQRTAVQYVANRLRQADRAGGIALQDFQGNSAIVLTEEIGGEAYETHIYCCGGHLRELFARTDNGLTPEDGEKVLELRSLEARWDEARPGRLLVELETAAGVREELALYLRCGEGAVS